MKTKSLFILAMVILIVGLGLTLVYTLNQASPAALAPFPIPEVGSTGVPAMVEEAAAATEAPAMEEPAAAEEVLVEGSAAATEAPAMEEAVAAAETPVEGGAAAAPENGGGQAPESELNVEITPISVLLIEVGDTAVFEASIVGGTSPDPVTWDVEDPSVVALDPNGNEVTVTALLPLTSTTVTASYKGITKTVTVVIATLGPNTRRIDHTLVRYDLIGKTAPDVIVLVETDETANIQPGEVLISNPVRGDQPGLLVRVVEVKIGPEGVLVTVEPASLTEAFEELHAQLIGDETIVSLLSPESIQCEITTGDPGTTSIDVTLLSISDQPFRMRPIITYDITNFTLNYLSLAYETTTNLTLTGPTIAISWQQSVTFNCSLELPEIPLAAFPLWGLSFIPKLSPEVGLEGSLAATIGSVTVKTLELTYQATHTYGFSYDAGIWAPINIHSGSGLQAQGPELESEPGVEFSASVKPYLSMSLTFSVNALIWSLLDVNFLEAEFALIGELTVPDAAIQFNAPPIDLNHLDPEWEVKGDTTLSLALDVDWGEVLGRFGVQSPPALNVTLVSYSAVMGSGPGFATSVTWDIGETGVITLAVAPPPGSFALLERAVYEGQPVQFWLLQQSSGRQDQIGEATIDSDGKATYIWPIQGEVVCTNGVCEVPATRTADYPISGQAGHWYRVHIADTGGVGVAAVLKDGALRYLSFCATGGRASCYHRPGVSSTDNLVLSVTSPFRNPGWVSVEDMGEGGDYVVALAYDRIFGWVGLEYATDAAAIFQ